MTPKSSLKTVVYSNESAMRSPIVLFKGMLTDLTTGRELAIQLAVRDIKAQYRQTFLGLAWAFLLPLANTAVWLFIQQSGIVTIQSTSLPYPVYVFTGTILWSIFMDSVNAPLQQTISAKPMLAKINFPRESLVVSGIFQALFNAAIKILIVLAALFLLGVHPDWYLVFFPFALLSLILAGTALGLLITPLGLLYTDIGKGLPLLLQFLMYFTPVVFPVPTAGIAATIFTINPLTPLIVISRDLLTGNVPHVGAAFILINLAMLILLFLMWIVYRLAMPILIERMNA